MDPDVGNMMELRNMLWGPTHYSVTPQHIDTLAPMPYIPEFQYMFPIEVCQNFLIDCSMFYVLHSVFYVDSWASTLHLWSSLLQPLLPARLPLSPMNWRRPLIFALSPVTHSLLQVLLSSHTITLIIFFPYMVFKYGLNIWNQFVSMQSNCYIHCAQLSLTMSKCLWSEWKW